MVALLCDRDLKGRGIPVTLFGEETTLPAGPLILACRTGAIVLPVGTYFARGAGHTFDVYPAARDPATGADRRAGAGGHAAPGRGRSRTSIAPARRSSGTWWSPIGPATGRRDEGRPRLPVRPGRRRRRAGPGVVARGVAAAERATRRGRWPRAAVGLPAPATWGRWCGAGQPVACPDHRRSAGDAGVSGARWPAPTWSTCTSRWCRWCRPAALLAGDAPAGGHLPRRSGRGGPPLLPGRRRRCCGGSCGAWRWPPRSARWRPSAVAGRSRAVRIIPNGLDTARYRAGAVRGARGGWCSWAATTRARVSTSLLQAWPRGGGRGPGRRAAGDRGRPARRARGGDVPRPGRRGGQAPRSCGEAAVLCAPNLGGESFGLVVAEGLAAGCAVVASDLPAFRARGRGGGAPGAPGRRRRR